MAPTLLKFGLLLLSQLHLTWALVPRAPATSSSASNQPQESSTIAADCIGFQLAQLDDDCTKFGIDREVFLSLNPGINKDCTNLLAGFVYCTKKADGSSSSSIDTSAKPTAATATAMTTMTTVTKTTTTSSATSSVAVVTPSPIQPGMVDNCNDFYFVKDKDDTCYSISQLKGKSIDDIKKWNPRVKGEKDDCTVWLNFYICTGVSG
ncbi:LysM domain-containing protein [Trichoderma lentiforme]|uniref:LysM domain-containing protein n=1 Tax=Trichoderma lentiforme TaxID=1567552 RepID=A0A9P5CA05_9HYPO|nr:LysM domain-containing protein [Trichoderma lentiforme]